MIRHDRAGYSTTSFRHACGLSLLMWLFLHPGCALNKTVPDQFVRQAEPGVTLTSLIQHPEAHKGKVVILGGVIVEEKRADGHVWLWIRNRPLDEDLEPHRDASRTASESGHYWIMADPRGLPKGYRSWARLTVAGLVTNVQIPKFDVQPDGRNGSEPILGALYMRGWSYGGRLDEVWEVSQDANYIQSNPLGELRQ